jgi:hypothetical protein
MSDHSGLNDHSGFFCQSCLAQDPIFSAVCDKCFYQSLEDDELCSRLHTHETGVYETAKKHNDGETAIIYSLYNQGPLPQDYNYYSTRGLLTMCGTADIHDKVAFHAALDKNLMVWKLPVLRGLTRNFCEPLAVLARSSVITVSLAKVILLMVGNCLRNKAEVLCLMDSVVYPENTEMKYHN